MTKLICKLLFIFGIMPAIADEYSSNSAPGHNVYLCTPYMVEIEKCTDIDQEYYRRLSIVSHGGYEIGLMHFEFQNQSQIGISVLGGISKGLTDDLQSVLDQYPNVTTLVVSSGGGDIEEGTVLYDLLVDNDLDVIVPATRGCLSSCADAVLGAKNLYVMGIYGFHSAWLRVNNKQYLNDLDGLNEFISKIHYDLQSLMVQIVSNRVDQGINLQFSQYIANQRGDFVTFLPNNNEVTNIKTIELTPSNTTVMTDEEMSDWISNQQSTDYFKFFSNHNIISIY